MTEPDYTLTSEQVRTLLELALIAEEYIEEVKRGHVLASQRVLQMYKDDLELATGCVKLLDGLVHGE